MKSIRGLLDEQTGPRMPDAGWWAKVARDRPRGEDRAAAPGVEAVTDDELREVESEARSFLVPGGRLPPDESFKVTESQRVIARVVFSIAGELRRLRSDEWIDLAADEIAGDPSCTSDPSRIADVIRGHVEAAKKR